MVDKCLLALILEVAEPLTDAILGMECLAHLLVFACPVAAGLDTVPPVEVS